MTWSARQYLAFEEERTRAVRDLLAAVSHHEARTAIDIGCGPGNSTEQLARRFPGAVVSGIDSSADMIEAARKRLPGVVFELTDIRQFAAVIGRPVFDVILANASLQWVGDHARLIPALMGRLAVGGALALQMPDNLDEPAHTAIREIASTGRWSGKLAHVGGRAFIATADSYFSMVRSMGGTADIWRTTYHHVLSGAAAIVEWFKGSGLRPYLAPLNPDERAEFLACYEAAVTRAYPALSDGTVLLPFPRLFMVAVR